MSLSRPARTVLAAALAMAALPAAAQDQPFSQTVFFGDSLTDAGYFRPLLPANVQAVTGQFTTNPGLVWSQWLADFYGTTAGANGNGQGGSNYAAGGARNGVNVTGALGFIPSLATQTGNYLAANGGRADPDALYTVWGGANDLFAVAANPGNAQAIIGGAVAAQAGIVGTLQAAGARYILVPTIPDLGLTPAQRAQGPAAQAQGTALATMYNDALFATLAANNLSVIPVDSFNFLREVVANPAMFGISNVTGTACMPQITAQSLTCNPTSLVSPDAPNSYLFADGVHPASGAHRAIADLAVAAIEGPRQMAVLPHSAAGTGRNRAERVAARIGVKPEADGSRWWTDLRGDFQRYGHGDHYDGTGPALTVGLDWTRGNLVYGAFAGYGAQGNDWGGRRGEWDQSEASLGGFAGWFGASGAWVNGQASYTRIDFDIERQVPLGPALRTHDASTDGSNLTLAVHAGWDFGDGALRHGPVLGVTAQRIDVDGFAESDPGLSTSLAYPDQSFDSLVGSAGWQVSYAITGHLQPYARLTVDREFEDAATQAFARSQSIAGSLAYAVPGVDYDQRYSTLTLGARTQLFGLDANVGSSLNIGQKGGKHAMVFATVGAGF
ncbi:autotransporter domain-containing protein [Luteimonas sp. MC1825]|uniref:autotransporter domain-containing protein n=1 Tax=Luteimonas sp. MC1825 TaxID=2761107 RepID=UPI00161B4A60|nr:autotransporter domain-containing protein [Luteimonas sp. MC1825]MBB6598483.1 autotransporter domain-containing protein [Luteimonas sp. MC1825]QOC88675.1 autotransporter domain-containing protein [Luteimonas sp. MC1825]